MSVVSKKIRAAFSSVNEATHAAHALTKLHTEVMSWISRAYECQLCMILPEDYAWFVATVREEPALVCHGP